MYGILAAKAASHKQLPIAPILQRHFPSYLTGTYLGCDVQTMPEAICIDTGNEVGYGTVPLEKSPLTGGKVRPFKLASEGVEYTPRQIHEMFYGRAHAVFGWIKAEQEQAVPWDHLSDYLTLAVKDTLELFGPGERPLAYVFGWMVHVIGDTLIKSIKPGLSLKLLDGQYTPKNRPIQDLVTFHEIGRKELRVNWPALLEDMAGTPVEPVQLHYMRIGERRGHLGRVWRDGWQPERRELLNAVLRENRRYLRFHARHVLKELELREVDGRWECGDALRQATGGLTYAQMLEAAEKSRFKEMLLQLAERIADMFAAVVEGVPELQRLPADPEPGWDQLLKKWRP
jgi:hypothetical protein